jgi:mannosyltransferase OCH1-like enzyme
MHDASKAGKWAFVSDYARIDILHQHGGVYLDTDVELLKPLDDFLHYPLFCGWEKSEGTSLYGSEPGERMHYAVNYGLGVGAVPGHLVLKELLAMYADMHFLMPDGSMNQVVCPVYQTRALQRFGLDAREARLQITDTFAVFPPEYFSPKSFHTGLIEKTENTVSIHHFSMSWKNKREKVQYWICSHLARYMSYSAAYHWVWKQTARYDYWMGRIKQLFHVR